MAIVKKSSYLGGGSAGSIPWDLNEDTLDKLSDPSIRLTNLTIQYGLRINKITWYYKYPQRSIKLYSQWLLQLK